MVVQSPCLTDLAIWRLIHVVLLLHYFLEDVIICEKFDLIYLFKLQKIASLVWFKRCILLVFFECIKVSKSFSYLLLLLGVDSLSDDIVTTIHDFVNVVLGLSQNFKIVVYIQQCWVHVLKHVNILDGRFWLRLMM